MLALLVSVALPNTTSAATVDYKIEINKKTNKLYLYKNGSVYKVYPVATGRKPSYTPEGTFPIVVQISQPGWKGIPGGSPNNPLGARWNGLSVNGDNGRTYGIHGTNNPASIGTHASAGCIRMYNSDVIELTKMVPIGTLVWIHSGTSNNTWRGKGSSGSSAKFQAASGKVQVTVDVANVRANPSLSATILSKAKRGTTFTLTAKSSEWFQVKLSNGKTAYLHYTVAKQISSSTSTVTVSVDVANIRSAPSLSAKVIQQAKRGTVFSHSGKSGDFYKISLKNGTTAYIHESVVR